MRWIAGIAAAVLLAGCGGGDAEKPAGGLSDAQRVEISEAIQEIEDCSGDVSASIELLTDTYLEDPDALYTEPGRSEEVPLEDALVDAQDELRAGCINGATSAEIHSITEAILAAGE